MARQQTQLNSGDYNMARCAKHVLLRSAAFLLLFSFLVPQSSLAAPAPATLERLTELRSSLQNLARDLSDKDPERAKEELDGLRAEWEELGHLAAKESDAPIFSAKVESLQPLLWNLERALRLDRAPPTHLPVVTPWDPHAIGTGNDQCSDATALSIPGEVAGTTTGTTNDGQATCGSSFFSADVWFTFTPTVSGNYSIDTFGSDFDTVISVHQECPGTTSNQITCNDDAFGHASAVSLFASSGTTYWIRVSGFNEETGDFQLRIGPGGSITGTVTAEDTGLPLSGGQVLVYNSSGFIERVTDPAADGTYSVTLDSDSYTLRASAFDEYLDEIYEDMPCQANDCEPEDGDLVPAITNQTTEGIDFSLPLGGRLSGTVSANDIGGPLEFASVRLYNQQGTQIAFALTEADGSYSFDELQTGSYRVTASLSGYRSEVYDDIPCSSFCSPSGGTLIAVSLGAETTGIDFGLDRLATITGTVTRQDTGEPVSGVGIELRNGNNFQVDFDFTGSDGTYTLGGLDEPGTFFAIASGAGMAAEVYDDILCHGPSDGCDATVGDPLQVVLNESISGIDFALISQGSISGTVEDQVTGALLSGVRIEVYNSSGGFVRSGSSNTEGNYTVAGLDAGSYRVRTDVSYGFNYFDELYEEISCANGCSVATGTPVVVALDTSTSGIDFTLQPGASISGRVTNETTGSTVSSQVELYDIDGNFVDSDFTSGGNYSFHRLPAGTYFLRTDTFGDLADELYQDMFCEPSCTVTDGTPVLAPLGFPVTDIDFALGPFPSGTVSGFVHDDDGAPLAGVSVALYSIFGSVSDSTSTAADGSYLFVGVPFGQYFVRTAGTQGYADELFDDLPCEPDCNETQGTPIQVDGDISGIDFELTAIGGFSGTVTDALTGAALNDYEVEVWNADGQLVVQAPVSGTGEYVVTLPPGTYYASTMSAFYGNHYLDELWNDIPCPRGAPTGCDPLTGTPIVIVGTNAVTGIDFTLEPPGRISGFVTDQMTGEPISSGEAVIWDADGRQVDDASLFNGVYTSDELIPGEYYVTTHFYYGDPSYLSELYDDIPCFGGAPSGCDPTKGQAVVVEPAQITRHINFELLPLGGDGDDEQEFDLVGVITDETGQPVSGVAVDFWRPDGTLSSTRYTNGQGVFFRDLYFGDAFYVSTDNGEGLIDEVWENISCPDGSAYEGLCDPTAGTLVEQTPSTVFFLEISLASSLPFFNDGFESGDTSAWSNVLGESP